MESRPLEITVKSANDLKDVNLFTKMDVYVVVSINGNPFTMQNQRTHVDKDCGPNPSWNFSVNFTVDEAALQQDRLTLKFEIKSERTLGDKDIGEVHVPIKELLDGAAGGDGKEHKKQDVSYSVRMANGKAKGTLNVAYKFGDKYEAPPPPAEKTKNVDQPVMAYPTATGYPGSGSAPYPAPGAYPYPPPGGYPPPPQQAYGYGGYPAQPPPGYGYPGYPPQPGYGGYAQPVVKPKKQKQGGGNMALGLGAGLLGGMLIGDILD